MERHVDVIAQDRRWDRDVGRGSFCVFVRRFPCGLEGVLSYAEEFAQRLMTEDRRQGCADSYYELVRDGRVLARIS